MVRLFRIRFWKNFSLLSKNFSFRFTDVHLHLYTLFHTTPQVFKLRSSVWEYGKRNVWECIGYKSKGIIVGVWVWAFNLLIFPTKSVKFQLLPHLQWVTTSVIFLTEDIADGYFVSFLFSFSLQFLLKIKTKETPPLQINLISAFLVKVCKNNLSLITCLAKARASP